MLNTVPIFMVLRDCLFEASDCCSDDFKFEGQKGLKKLRKKSLVDSLRDLVGVMAAKSTVLKPSHRLLGGSKAQSGGGE